MLREQDGQACRNTAACEMKTRIHASRGWARPAWVTWIGKACLAGLWSRRLLGTCSVQFSRSVMSDSATPRTAAWQASPSITNSRSPPKPMSTESVMPSSHLLFRPLLFLPSVFPHIRVFSNESALYIRWTK